MITPNGGVFGRNPDFNNVTVNGTLTVNGDIALGDDITVNDTLTVNGAATFRGGITSTPNASAPTTNVVLGPSAGAALNANAVSNVLVGNGAGDVLVAAQSNVAVGTNALGAFISGAEAITNTTPGTGGTPSTTITNVQLEKDSGTGDMLTYPIVTIITNSGGAVQSVTITSPGTRPSVRSGIILKANAAGVSAGVPLDWRGTLSSVRGLNTAIGHQAGLLMTTAQETTLVGCTAGDAITTADFNTAIGSSALSAVTTGSGNTAVGRAAGEAINTGERNVLVGANAGRALTTGVQNVAMGSSALNVQTTASNCVAIGDTALAANVTGAGHTAIGLFAGLSIGSGGATASSNSTFVGQNAGRRRGSGTDTLTQADNSIFIGNDARANGNGQTNQTVIGDGAIGDGSNTVVIGNSSVTSHKFHGTSTSAVVVSGDTLRIVTRKAPASNAAGTAGDVCIGEAGGTHYLYYCIANNNWGRVAFTTGY